MLDLQVHPPHAESTTSRKNGSEIDTSAPNLSVCQSEHDKEVIDQKVQQVGIVWHSASGTMQRLNNSNNKKHNLKWDLLLLSWKGTKRDARRVFFDQLARWRFRV